VKLVQVVPRLPPATDGVSGYAAALSQALAQRGVTTHFVDGAAPDGHVVPLIGEGHSGGAVLSRQLADSGTEHLLVHYVNYGYQSRGCPISLVRGAVRWRAAKPTRRLVTMFHEVYANGPPWRSSFWLGPVQRRLAAQLLRASDGAVTSLALYGRMLTRWGPRREVVVAPVFSAVGEPATAPAPEERRPRVMLVFGGAGNRRRAYDEHRAALAAACQALDIAEILDLGPPLADLPGEIVGRPVRSLGARPKEEVSAVMLRSFAGFLAYPPLFLEKSTVFAGYCAHGLVPVCTSRGRARRGPEGPPYWEPILEAAPTEPGGLAAKAQAWYSGHNLTQQAATFHDLLASPGTAEARES
jgi:hypothetical protein